MSQEHTCETCGAALDAEATLCLHCGAPGPAGAAGGDEVYRETGFRAQALPVAAGDVLSGRFRLLRALGRGGMGVVWLASDEELDGQHVALKVLRPEITADSGGVADMKREVIITRALRHPHIVAVYDHHTEGERVFITMAYIDGPSLADAFTARERKPYTLEEVLPWARQVAEALDYAHGRGVLHRDVKPGNILLARDGTAHLTDFGIARMARDTLSRRSGHTASGTLAYMSPQQLLDEKAHRNDPRNDVYSFAATLYELLSGEPPFTSGGIEAQIALKQPDPIESVPDYVNDALLQGLAKEVDQRPESCTYLVDAMCGKAERLASYENLPLPEPERRGTMEDTDSSRTVPVLSAKDLRKHWTIPGIESFLVCGLLVSIVPQWPMLYMSQDYVPNRALIWTSICLLLSVMCWVVCLVFSKERYEAGKTTFLRQPWASIFAYEGALSRRDFAISLLIVATVLSAATFVYTMPAEDIVTIELHMNLADVFGAAPIGGFIAMVYWWGEITEPSPGYVFLVIASGLLILPLMIKRLRDIGHSPFFLVGCIVPLLFTMYLLFAPPERLRTEQERLQLGPISMLGSLLAVLSVLYACIQLYTYYAAV